MTSERTIKLNHLLIPYLALLAFLLTSLVGGNGIMWYQTLVLPAWHPSLNLIAVIWAIIYLCGARSVMIIWNHETRHLWWKHVTALFVTAGVLNVLWALLFFMFHMIFASVWSAVALAITILVLIACLWPHAKKAALLLLPFVLWVLYASYLTYTLGILNA